MIVNRLTILVFLSSNLFANALYAQEKLADPTMPANYSAGSATSIEQPPTSSNESQIKLTLNSTIISPYQEIAVINGKQLKVGEEINGATIIKITHQRVILNYNKKNIELLLQRSFISQVNAATHK